MNDFAVYQPSLEFLLDLVKLADQCTDHDADRVSFDLGPIDGMAMEVTIEFKFKEV